MFNRDHCPLLQSRLSWPMRIMYMSGVWSYIVGAIATPLFIVIPIVTVWFGVFPIVVSCWAALGLTVYFVATNAVLYYVRRYYPAQDQSVGLGSLCKPDSLAKTTCAAAIHNVESHVVMRDL